MTGLWLARSRSRAAVRSGASTPGAARGEESRSRSGAAASRIRSRTPPPRPRAAANRTPPPGGPRRPTRKGAATDRRERAAAEAPRCAATPELVRQSWRRRNAVRRHDSDLHALVGPACETAEAHKARHPGYGHHQTCPRCRCYKVGPSWVSAYGTVSSPGHGPDQVLWLAVREALSLGRALGIGLHHLRTCNGSAAAGREQRCRDDARDRRCFDARRGCRSASAAAGWNRVDAVRSSWQVLEQREHTLALPLGAARARCGELHGTARTCADQDAEY